MNALAISSIFNIITGVLVAGFFLRNHNNSKPAILWGVTGVLCAIWGVGVLILSTTKEISIAFIGWQIAQISTILVPVVYHNFVLEYIEYQNKKQLFYLYTIALIVLFINFFNLNLFLPDLKFVFGEFYYADWTTSKSALYLIFYLAFNWILLLYSFFLILRYFKFCRPKVKNQLRYIVFGSIVLFIGIHGDYFIVFGYNIYPYSNFLFPVGYFIIVYGVFKCTALGIEVVFQKSLAYTILILLAAFFYFVVVFIFEKLIQGFWGYRSISASLTIAFLIGIIFFPLHNQLQKIVDKIIFKKSPEEISNENTLLRAEIVETEKLKAISTLASGMAHEIRNPLTALRTFSEYLPKKLDDKKFLLEFARIVGSEVDRIDSLVTELLEFAKPSPVQLTQTNLNKLIKDTLDFLSSKFVATNIQVTAELAPECDQLIMLDSNKIKQALLNIILNAVDAMKMGGTLTVSTLSSPQSLRGDPLPKNGFPLKDCGNDRITITITDTGCGITKENLTHIFDPFFSTKDTGTGLGLPVTYGIIQEHKGEIKVDSLLGKGTTFTIILPTSMSNEIASP